MLGQSTLLRSKPLATSVSQEQSKGLSVQGRAEVTETRGKGKEKKTKPLYFTLTEPLKSQQDYLHLTNEETETPKSLIICLGSHS